MTTDRIYSTAAWQRLRRRKLAASPLCHACALRGRVAAADTVDHVLAVANGGPAFPPLAGLMSLCARCHNEKTNAVDRPDRRATGRRFKGFDADGNPIDPGDAWHGKGRGKDGKLAVAEPARYSRSHLVANSSQRGGGNGA